MALDIFDIVQLGRERVLDIDDKDLPVGLAFIKKGHDAEDFDLLNLPYITHLFADLADIQRIVVAISLGLGVLLSGILPSLHIHTVSSGARWGAREVWWQSGRVRRYEHTWGKAP